MNPVGLRLHLASEVLSKLVTAVADKFRRFVRISRSEHAGAFYQVDLRILGVYDAKEPKAGEGIHPTESVTVTREMIGELFDLLGIFPRGEKLSVTLAQTEPELQFISEKIDTIQNVAMEIHGLVSGRRLGGIEEILKAASLVKHKISLLRQVDRAQ